MCPASALKVEPVPNPDAEVILQAQAGDAKAFEELHRSVESRLFRQAVLWSGNETVARELAQETLVEVWKSLHRYNGRCEFFTWACAILHHRYHNRQRRKGWLAILGWNNTGADDTQRIIEQEPDTNPSPDQAVTALEEAALIRRCIDRLPAKQQQVVLLRFFVDQSLESIAAALNCSVGTVKSRLFHALENLRRMPCFKNDAKNPLQIPCL